VAEKLLCMAILLCSNLSGIETPKHMYPEYPVAFIGQTPSPVPSLRKKLKTYPKQLHQMLVFCSTNNGTFYYS